MMGATLDFDDIFSCTVQKARRGYFPSDFDAPDTDDHAARTGSMVRTREDVDRPPFAWDILWHGNYTLDRSNWVGEAVPCGDELRAWGYVFWDGVSIGDASRGVLRECGLLGERET
jgi:hypothetical protein